MKTALKRNVRWILGGALALAVIALTVPYAAVAASQYRSYWEFPGGEQPWVTPQLKRALKDGSVWIGIVFVRPSARTPGPAPNDVRLKNPLLFVRDRGAANAAFAALYTPRPYFLCDYSELERTGEMRLLDIRPPLTEKEK